MHGGTRQGAGRKQSYSAIKAEEARKYVAQRVSEEIAPLTDVLLEKAKSGDLKTIQILLDRAWGRPSQEIQFSQESVNAEPSDRIKHLAKLLNT